MAHQSQHLRISLIFLVFVLATLFTLTSALYQNPNKNPDSISGKKALEFSAIGLSGPQIKVGEKIALQQFSGKALVLNFFSSWCATCASEASALEDFWQSQKTKGVQVVGIAVQDTLDAAIDATKEHHKSYVVALDEEGEAGVNYGITGVPETVFINKEGIVVTKVVGAVTKEILEQKLALMMQ